MGLLENLSVVLLWTLISNISSLDIPLKVEQPPTILSHSASPVVMLPSDTFIVITCEAKGNPPPNYRWTKDGKDLLSQNFTITTDASGGTVRFHNMPFQRAQGKYKCFASNELGTAMSEDIEIIVYSPPKFPREKLPPAIVNEGDPIVLECNPPEDVFPLQLYWMTIDLVHIEQDNRVTMGTDGNLYFSHALLKDSREDYCCYAASHKIRTLTQKDPMAVVVDSVPDPQVRAPSMLLPSGVQTEKVLLKGRELRLECIPAGFPTPDVTWMKMGEELSDRVEFKNFNKLLTIPAVTEGDEGKYMCTAKNSVGMEVHYFDVKVEEPPIWLSEDPQAQLTMIGSDVHLKCDAGGKPPPDITWMKNGEVFKDDPDNKKRVLDDTLVLRNARPEDTGVYQCEASNTHGSLLANINVLVMSKPPVILTEDFQEYTVIHGRPVVMNCSVFSFPPSSILWIKEGGIIEGDRFVTFENNQLLKIQGAVRGDSGIYKCVAKNSEGVSTISAVLDVKEPTIIVSPPENVQIVSGTSAQLVCRVEYDESLRDNFEVFWRKDGEEIPLSPETSFRYVRKEDMLKIMNVNVKDQGMYMCIARTSLDEVNATAFLSVLDVPDAPKNLKIIEVNDSRSIVISWEPGSDHNSSVTEFVVEFEESQWEPGRWKELRKVLGNQATAELALYGNLKYQFRVYAVNAIGPGPPSEPSERHNTNPAAPDRNPENIQIQGHVPHKMEITWDPLSVLESNGPGLEYKVSYRKVGVEEAWTEEFVPTSSFTVKNTSAFVPYEIKVHARNSHGWAPEPKVVTGYSGEDTPTAAPQDVAVEVINSTDLRVSWTQVPPATVRGRLEGYKVQWVKRKSFLNPSKILNKNHTKSFPGKKSHANVSGLEPFSEYLLTVSVYNKKGSGPKSDPVTFSTPEGVPGLLPILSVSDHQTDYILLEWRPPQEMNGHLSGYFLQYDLINEDTREVIESQELNITGADTMQWKLPGLKRDNLYTFHLSACTKAGCGPALPQEARVISTPVPALLNISSYVSDTFAKISWTATKEQREVQLYVAYKNNRDGKWHISEAINVSQSFHIIDGLEPGTMYTVRLMPKKLLDNASIFEDVIQTKVQERITGSDRSSRWVVGTVCFVVLLIAIALISFCLWKRRGGKYPVKEKNVPPDPESQEMIDESSDKKLLAEKDICPPVDLGGDGIRRDSLGCYSEEGGEFSEDGSFIGEYTEQNPSVGDPFDDYLMGT